MSAPAGLFDFPGINTIIGGTFTLSHGISPSIATIEIPPATNFAVPMGTLTISYGTGVRFSFPDCKLDMASLSTSESGRVWTVRLKDRRWKWEYGKISGVYNQRTPDGEFDTFPVLPPKDLTAAILKAKGDKTPQELATLLLDAMGETNYDISQLPNTTRPAVNWVDANPAEELTRLCEPLGCHVVLGTDNRVRICLLGSGQSLSTTRIMSGGYGFDPPEMPDSLEFVAGQTVYQARLLLEAIGLDLDGIYKPLKDLSYNPFGEGETYGWCGQNPETLQALIGTDTLSARTRNLALSTVFHDYRITDVSTQDMHVPNYGTLTSIKQVLPLGDTLIDLQEFTLTAPPVVGSELPQPAGAIVTGVFYRGNEDPKTFVNSTIGTKYTGGFSIDRERGIVHFNDPTFLIALLSTDLTTSLATTPQTIVKSGSFAAFPAKLVLECTFSIHHPDTRAAERYSQTKRLTNNKYGTQAKIIKREDERLEVRCRYQSQTNSSFSITNITSLIDAIAPLTPDVRLPSVTNELGSGLNSASKGLKDRAKYYLDAAAAMYQPKQSLTASYPTLVNIQPDGRIHQVTWKVSESGATTEASENSEFDMSVPSYGERRAAEIAQQQRIDITNGKGGKK